MDDFLKELWHDLAGKPYVGLPKNIPSIEELRKTEWCQEFEDYMLMCCGGLKLNEEFIGLMKNRLVMGAFRYGLMAKQDYCLYDLTGQAAKKFDKYLKTKNLEYIVDAANNCLLAYVHWKRQGYKVTNLNLLRYYHSQGLEQGLKAFKETNELEYIVWCAVFLMTAFAIAKRIGHTLNATDDVDHSEIIK